MGQCFFKDKNSEWELISISDFNGYKKYEIKKVGDDYNLEVWYANYSWIDVEFKKYTENNKPKRPKDDATDINFGF